MDTIFKCNNVEIDKSILSKALLERKSADCDTLTLHFFDGESYAKTISGAVVEVIRNGVRTFRGRVTKTPQRISALENVVEVVAKNPWNDLERIIYQQLWASANTESGDVVLSPVFRSKIVLAQDSAGNKITVAQQLRDILEYAISKGAEFQIGAIDTPAQMVLDEAKDLSCAEALARVLKWTPNASVFFDYSTAGLPVLNIISRANLPTADIDAQSGSVSKIKVTPRPDLNVSSVSIKYERENTKDDFTWITVDEDSYPQNIPTGGINAIVMSVELAGVKESCQVHQIVCKTIQLESLDWWKDKLGDFLECTELTVTNPIRHYSNHSRELIEGSICAEMNFAAETDYITATVSYIDKNLSEVKKQIGIHTVVTNAVTGTYPVWTKTQISEDMPIGLAKAIYEAVGDMQYEGSLALLDTDSAQFMGARICVKNADPNWATMNAPTVSVVEDILKRTAVINFGPPKHLYPDNIAELFRINRQRKAPTNLSARASGQVASAKIKISGASANSDTSTKNTTYSRLVVADSGEESSIDLNSKGLGKGKKAKFQEIYICYEGKLAKSKFLSTTPDIIS